MQRLALSRLLPLNRTRILGGVLALVAMTVTVGISILASDVLRQIEKESEARVDNVQWVLSQFEMELLYLAHAAEGAELGTATLADVRLRYDIFYSRLETMREGQVFEGLRQTEGFEKDFALISGFMEGFLPYIDGSDTQLIFRLHELHEKALELTAVARDLALRGVRDSAESAAQRRAEVRRTLLWTGGLTLVLVASLVAALVMLLRLIRTNRVRAAENLAMLSRLDAVVSTAMEALITLDGRGRIVDLNAAACETFGMSRAYALGRDMASLCAPDPEAGGAQPFRVGEAPNVAGQGRYRLLARHGDGRLFPAEVSVARVRSGPEVLFVLFLRDLSAQLSAERALVAARDRALEGETAKARLLAVMSHEIRTPLNGMIGTIELLDGTRLTAQQREYLRILQASGRLLMHHVNDVLDITRLESGRAPPAAEPLDLAELVREVLENQSPTSRDNGNRLEFQAPAGGVWVMADGAQLRQVLLNLVGNAVKFTRNGTITVEVEQDAEARETEIRVIDTGIGIAAADLGRIFDDFVTLDASYARNASGTGLGLGIVRRIVAQMGGQLSVDSVEGQGSTFRLRLPLGPVEGAAAASGPQGSEEVAAPTAPLSALVVEDNDFNRLIVRELLRHEGHDVTEARDAEEGIALAAWRRFDVILMDISMPGMDGLEATAAIRQGQGASVGSPILAMTAHALDEDVARFKAGGMSAVLVKPITRQALRAALAPIASRPDTADPLLDRALLNSVAEDLGPAQAGALVQRFCAEAAASVDGLEAALKAGRLEAGDVRVAHRLAGSCAMFGLERLHNFLTQLERNWRAGALTDLEALARDLRSIWQDSLAEVQEAQSAERPQASSLR